MPLRQPVHGGGCQDGNRKLPIRCVAGGWEVGCRNVVVLLYKCNKSGNRAIPSDILASQLAGIPRQKEHYVPPVVAPQSEKPHVPTPGEKPLHCRCHHVPARALAGRTS